MLLHGRDVERGRKIAEEFPGKTAFHIDDLADPAAPRRIVKAASTPSAASTRSSTTPPGSSAATSTSTDAALFDRVMAINVRAPCCSFKAAHAAPQAVARVRSSTSARSTPTPARATCSPTASRRAA